jgi:hypothetical protein
MKKLIALLFLVLFICGCATASYGRRAKSIWPQPSSVKWYWSNWQMFSSADEAIGVLKNIQQGFVEYAAGQFFKTFDVDKYGLRVKWEWTETSQTTEYVPTYGGSWFGSTYVPYYGGTNQTRTNTSQREGAFVIPFAEVSDIWMAYVPNIARPYKWQISVSLGAKPTINLRAIDEQTARQLGNAIATLSREQGRVLPRYFFGVSLLPLTPEQSAELSLVPGTGVVVSDVPIGSPAEKAGVLFLDVILEVDGQPVKNYAEVDAQSTNKKSVKFKILRRQKVADPTTGKMSLQNTELSLPVNIE